MWKPMLSCRPMKPRVGMVTIGQAPRVDVVPAMADVLGPDVEIIERGALDGLGGDEIAQLAPESDDEVLVTRLTDGSSVFVGKRGVTPLPSPSWRIACARAESASSSSTASAFNDRSATRCRPRSTFR